ncbi:PF13788 domain protein [Peptostreptococcaceae bacterium AS15]|nr:PF13788 domain protein [Peptostreptococcaceae bacterium AS15]
MNYRIINNDDKPFVVRLEDDKILIRDEQSMLDMLMTIAYDTGLSKVIIDKDNLTEDFFILSNKIAGNILQKVVNYNMKLAIIGDFSKYDSKALRDFIYECNSGKDIFFVEDETMALKMLKDN